MRLTSGVKPHAFGRFKAVRRHIRAVTFATIGVLVAHTAQVRAANVQLGVADTSDPATAQLIQALMDSPVLKSAEITIVPVDLGGERDIADMLIAGEIGLGLVSIWAIEQSAIDAERHPILAPVLNQPFQFASTEELLGIQETPFGEAILADINRTGLVGLSFWNRGQTHIVSRMDITTAADLKGLNIRTFRLQEGDEVLVAMGASRFALPAAEVPMALQAGAIEAAEILPDTAQAYLTEDTATLIPNYRPLVGILAASADFWSDRTEREKAALAAAAREAQRMGNIAALQVESSIRVAAQGQGVSMLNLAAAEPSAIQNASGGAWVASRGKGSSFALDQLRVDLQALPSAKGAPAVALPMASADQVARPILFVTDRGDEGGAELRYRFGSRRDAQMLSCGQIAYTSRSPRKLGTAFDAPIKTLPDPLPRGNKECIDLVAARAAEAEGRVLLFLHGFNNTFDEAVRRAIAMASDIAFEGIVVVWSWPADGTTPSYFRDEESARWSRPHLNRFVKELVTRQEIARVDLVAHSMGSRLALWLLESLAEADRPLPIGSVVFAAPDEAQDIFEQGIWLAGTVGSLRTLYAAKYDRPLQISGRIHRSPRAGVGGDVSILVIPGMESVDVTAVEAGYFGSFFTLSHAHVFAVPEAIRDLGMLITGDMSATARNLRGRVKAGQTYWLLDKH